MSIDISANLSHYFITVKKRYFFIETKTTTNLYQLHGISQKTPGEKNDHNKDMTLNCSKLHLFLPKKALTCAITKCCSLGFSHPTRVI